MKNIELCDKKNCFSEKMENLLLDEEIPFSKILECENCTSRLHRNMEAIGGTFETLMENYLTRKDPGMHSEFNEELDIRRMDSKLPNKPLPSYLKKFIQDNRPSSSENLSLLCIISETIKVFDVLGKGLVEGLYPLSPAFRSAGSTLKYKILEESEEEIKFSYQFIKEADDLVYLTIQLHPKTYNKFQEVELNLNQRLLMSCKINDQGIVHFPNLQEGMYKLNFNGKNSLKSVDLTIYAE